MVSKYLHPDGQYYISTNIETFDLELVHKWLSVDAYWSVGIPFELVKKSFNSSLSFGVFTKRGAQIGMARMVTDKATFGYLADVFLSPEYRGQGLAKWLMDTIMLHPDLTGLRRIMLATSDMHALYKQYGFERVSGHPLLMEIMVPDIYTDDKQS